MNSITDHIKQYIDLQKQRVLLNVADKTSRLVAEVTIYLVFALAGFIALLLLGFGLAMAVNVWLQSSYWGFFIMALVFAVLGLLLFFRGKKWVTNIIAGDILNMLYEDDEEKIEEFQEL